MRVQDKVENRVYLTKKTIGQSRTCSLRSRQRSEAFFEVTSREGLPGFHTEAVKMKAWDKQPNRPRRSAIFLQSR